MDTRVRRQVNARVSFVCLFVFSCIFNVISIFTVSFDSKGRQRQNVFIWIKVYSFRLNLVTKFNEANHDDKKASKFSKGWETYCSRDDEFSRQKYY